MVLGGLDMTNNLKGWESKPLEIVQSTKTINNQKIRILTTVKINKGNKKSEKPPSVLIPSIQCCAGQ